MMPQQVKGSSRQRWAAAKPYDWNTVSGTHRLERKTLLSKVVLSSSHTHTYRCVDISPSQKHTNKLIENSMIFNNDTYTKYLRRLQLSLGSTY